MKKGYSTFIALLLFTLMFFKVSASYAHTHADNDSDEIENCSLCELAVENQNTDFLPQAIVTVPQNHFFSITYKQPATKNVAISSTFLRFNFFGRPPPHLV